MLADCRQADVPFGKLLLEPFCTSECYLCCLMKVFITSSDALDPEIIANLTIKIQTSAQLYNACTKDCFPAISILLKRFTSTDIPMECFVEQCVLLCATLAKLGIIHDFHDQVFRIVDILVSAAPSALLRLDEALCSMNIDLFCIINTGRTIEGKLLDYLRLVKIISSNRFDDDFKLIWTFLQSINQRWLPTVQFPCSPNIICAYMNVLEMLCKISESDEIVEMFMGIVDKMFQEKLNVSANDDAMEFFQAFSSLFVTINQRLGVSDLNWIWSAFSANIRRLTPNEPTDDIQIMLSNLVLMLSLMTNIPDPLTQGSVSFIKAFFSMKGISKHPKIANSLIVACFDLSISDQLRPYSTQLLEGFLTHCEGVIIYNDLLKRFLQSLLKIEFSGHEFNLVSTSKQSL